MEETGEMDQFDLGGLFNQGMNALKGLFHWDVWQLLYDRILLSISIIFIYCVLAKIFVYIISHFFILLTFFFISYLKFEFTEGSCKVS